MQEYKLTVRATSYQRGIYYYYYKEQAFREKQKWERRGFLCTIEEVEN